MKKLLTLALLAIAVNSSAQKTVNVDKVNPGVSAVNSFYVVGGEPFLPVKYVRVVEGSPYFTEQWMKGSVFFEDGTGYGNLMLKLDLLAGTVHYLDLQGAEMVVQARLKEVILTDTLTGKEHAFVYSDFLKGEVQPKSWYRRLVQGKASLYMLERKTVHETKAYGSSLNEQRIDSRPQYYVEINGSMRPVKKLKELPALLSDREEPLAQYIRQEYLLGKNESDYIRVVNYYNQLRQ